MAKKNLGRGMLITFEGPEGSGKSTQARLLADFLSSLGFSVLQLREPGGTRISEKIRQILLDPRNKEMNAECETFLYQGARAQLVQEKVIPALAKKQIVIMDRFLDATICYQGYGAGIDISFIKRIGKVATYGIEPDLTILLKLDAREGLRRAKRYDRMERKPLNFHRKVLRGYLDLAAVYPGRIKVVTVAEEIDQTQRAVRKLVLAKLK
ncbi:MAG: dTMP kinase [Candidatus Omnitrophota bacterium]